MKHSLTIFFLLITSFCFSQGEANVWYFGDKAGLDFNNGTPVALTDGQMYIDEGCATISNSIGQLLMYTNGTQVWNRNHQIMPNGSGLLGNDSSTQSALIVPKPNSSNIYYIFTSAALADYHGVNYSEVDINLNGGLGDVTVNKNIPILSPASEKITVVKKLNGIDYWVVIHKYGNNSFYCYSLTSSGLNMTPVISSVGALVGNNNDVNQTVGYLKFSPDGTKLISCSYDGIVELFDFNSTNGMITNPRLVSSKWANYGAEFSPSGNIAYITTGDQHIFELLQYDLTASNISATAIQLYSVSDINHQIGSLQLAPDGKIYTTIFDENYVCAINNPNTLGIGCNFQLNVLSLLTGIGKAGLPQFIQSYFNTSFRAQNFCLGGSTNFSFNSSTPSSVLWDFGDGTTSISLSPNHQYVNPGNYTVTLTATSSLGVATSSKDIHIYNSPVISMSITNQSVCGTQNMNYDLSLFNSTLLGTQSTSDFAVTYFSSLLDATNHSNALPNNINLSLGQITIYAKIYNVNNTSCNVITSFTVTLYQQPTVNNPSDYIICENLPYDNIEQFNLSTKNNEILNSLSPINYTISYHLSQNDANNNLAPLPLLYTNTNPTQTLYVRVENNNNSSCFSTTTLVLKVVHQPSLSLVTDYKLCDDASNDGIASFDLTTKTLEVLNGQPSSTFVVNYFLTLTDAQNQSNPITSNINNTSNNQIIYYSISAIGNNNCSIIGSFKLIVNDLPRANLVSDFYMCDDVTNDGVESFDLTTKNSSILANQNPTNYTVHYFLSQSDADSNLNQLPANYSNITNPQTIYVRVENNLNTNCFATTTFKIGLYKKPIAHQPLNSITCDDDSNDGKELFDLSSQNAVVLATQLPTQYTVTYYISQSDANAGINALSNNYTNIINPQIIYVRIQNNLSPSCFDTTSFELRVEPKPVIVLNDTYTICQGNSINIFAPIGFNTYLWSNGDTSYYTTITQAGNYSLTVTKDYGTIICNQTKNFTVVNSNVATITNIEFQDWTDNQNTITVQVMGDGDYEYSLDNIHFQNSNEFTNLLSGDYTVYVRDKKGCGTSEKEVFLLMYPKFFTPNGDGYNDLWKIKFSKEEPNMLIYIYDRYGKLVRMFKGQDVGWDGTLNGALLFSDDYWFVVKRENGKQYKGHFTLKR